MKVYDEYAKKDHLVVQQDKTIAENLADIGGFLISEMAFIKYMEKRGYTYEEKTRGLKDFYHDYSEKWRTIIKPSVIQNMIETDIHSLSKYRVNCVLAFSDKFCEIVYGMKKSPYSGDYPF